MVDFYREFPKLLDYILDSESDPEIGDLCACGEGISTCCCRDCTFYRPTCAPCFVKSHLGSNPFHWAEVWNGTHFERHDISEVVPGTVVTVGHTTDRGKQCPYADYSKPLEFILTCLNGTHRTKVVFCECKASTVKRYDHLMSMEIFPSTLSRPESGFTFTLLRDFHLQTLTSKKSSYDYMEAIRCKTNNAFPQNVPDMYKNFVRVQRVWRALSNIKRNGQGHDIDKFLPFRPKGSVSVPCFACPEPEFNTPEEANTATVDLTPSATAALETKHVDMLYVMMDGHFGLQRFAMVDDPDDISLLRGMGFFPLDDEYNAFVLGDLLTSEEKATCSKFNAVEMQNKLKFKGCVITGVLGVECGRHSIFLSMVDLQKGERFGNADFALARALRRFLPALTLGRAKFFKHIVVTYDVACQYFVKLKERFKLSFPLSDVSVMVDMIHMLVPKMHLAGHKEDCRYRFSLNYFDGAGRLHGEGIEPSWAETKQSGGSTQHMNHGHRHDTIIDFHNYWNWRKNRMMSCSLEEQLNEATKMRSKMITQYKSLSRNHGQDKVEGWLKEPTAATRAPNGEWKTDMCCPVPTQEEIMQSFQSKEKSDDAPQEAGASIVFDALKIEEKQYVPFTLVYVYTHPYKRRELRALVKSQSTPAEDLKERRTKLSAEIKRWRKRYIKAAPLVESLIAASPQAETIEDESLHLPSSITLAERTKRGLLDLSIFELKLREGEANTAVAGICNSLIHENLLSGVQKQHSRGVYQNTRSHQFINRVKAKRRAYAAQYRECRRRLLELNNLPSTATLSGYPTLQAKDMFQKNATQSRVLGEGKETDSWIWSYGNLRDMDEKEKLEFLSDGQ
ncbi:hypothetical protein DFP72DRAFT_799713 [Ephemerocybe angulata]|uniref:CxC2-like cysteine cluster KDZ transposase-associated domain-containing protein n=1 Tax=Ephemerocybe angulata TaxID=980116 RepID=A0A8H6IF60_9AGAR|nr:hypothetical protein DFP72DRAFT_799713 [Tulosesus angulatus]